MKLEKITRDFIKTLTEPQKKQTTAYDSKGIVTRIEDGIAWVKLAGSKIETPLQMTISADPGDEVQARIGNGTGWLTGNGTAPPTDDRMANKSYKVARNADQKAGLAQNAAAEAFKSAEDAAAAASSAQESANNASGYASRALGSLATVQSVAEALTWITQHGTMTLTSDAEIDPTHVYFVVDAAGDYVVGGTHYSIVTEPKEEDLGTYYELSIDESLNNYVGTHLALTSEGLWLLPATSGVDKILIATGAGSTYTTAGMYIIDSTGATVARFGAVSVIGIEDSDHSRLRIDFNSIRAVDKEGHPYFFASDLRDENDVATLTELFTGNGTESTYSVHANVYSVVSVKVEGVAVGYSRLGAGFVLDDAPADGDEIEIIYRTKDSFVKAYTLGFRYDPDNNLGPLSVAEGYNVQAVGSCSHAEGNYTKAIGYAAHAEGNSTEATQENAHAEGRDTHATRFCSHAEGYHSKANGHTSHAEGYGTETKGYASHAQNYETIAAADYQTVLGKHNVESVKTETFTGDGSTKNFTLTENPESIVFVTINGETVSDYNFIKKVKTDTLRFTTAPASGATIKVKYVIYKHVLIVGKGTSDSSRSNALELAWTGDLTIAGALTQNSDKRLKEHIDYLGEDAAEFIRKLKPAHYKKDGEDHVGFYAQDVAVVDPWRCTTGKMNGYMTLGYTELLAPLVAYCQSLERRIKALEEGE